VRLEPCTTLSRGLRAGSLSSLVVIRLSIDIAANWYHSYLLPVGSRNAASAATSGRGFLTRYWQPGCCSLPEQVGVGGREDPVFGSA